MNTESRLSDLLTEFARTLVTDSPIQSILDPLVVRIVDLLPVGSVGATLISTTGGPRHIAASDSSARRFVRLQAEMAEGPCMAAYSTGACVTVPDLRDDKRFPAFTRRGLEEGLRAVFSFPLIHRGATNHSLPQPSPIMRRSAGPHPSNSQDRSDDRDNAPCVSAESSELRRWEPNRWRRLKHAVPTPLSQGVVK